MFNHCMEIIGRLHNNRCVFQLPFLSGSFQFFCQLRVKISLHFVLYLHQFYYTSFFQLTVGTSERNNVRFRFFSSKLQLRQKLNLQLGVMKIVFPSKFKSGSIIFVTIMKSQKPTQNDSG